MEFIHLTDSEDFRAGAILEAYNSTFPENERRDAAQFNKLFNHSHAKIFCILNELECIGYVVVWELSNFTFLEHFEVYEKFRNQNFGAKILSLLFEKYGKLVLEAEPETESETAKRRIDFYKRNCYNVIDENYVQPSYGEGKSPLNLWLLANWQPGKTDWIKEEIYDVVYCR